LLSFVTEEMKSGSPEGQQIRQHILAGWNTRAINNYVAAVQRSRTGAPAPAPEPIIVNDNFRVGIPPVAPTPVGEVPRATPATRAKRGKGASLLTEENIKIGTKILSDDPFLSRTEFRNALKKAGVKVGRIEKADEIRNRVVEGDGSPIPYDTPFPFGIVKSFTTSTLEQHVEDGGLTRGINRKYGRAGSRWYAAVKTAEGKVVVAPLIKPGGSGKYQIIGGAYDKGMSRADPLGSYNLRLDRIGEGAELIEIFAIDHSLPARQDRFVFSSTRTYEAFYKSAGEVAAPSISDAKVTASVDSFQEQGGDIVGADGREDTDVLDSPIDVLRGAGVTDENHAEPRFMFTYMKFPSFRERVKAERERRKIPTHNTAEAKKLLAPIVREAQTWFYEEAKLRQVSGTNASVGSTGGAGLDAGVSKPASNGGPRERGGALRTPNAGTPGGDVAARAKRPKPKPDPLAGESAPAKPAATVSTKASGLPVESGQGQTDLPGNAGNPGDARRRSRAGGTRPSGDVDGGLSRKPGTAKAATKKAAKVSRTEKWAGSFVSGAEKVISRASSDEGMAPAPDERGAATNAQRVEEGREKSPESGVSPAVRNAGRSVDLDSVLLAFFQKNSKNLPPFLTPDGATQLYLAARTRANGTRGVVDTKDLQKKFAQLVDKMAEARQSDPNFRYSLSDEPDARWTGIDNLDIIGGYAAELIQNQTRNGDPGGSTQNGGRLYEAASLARGARARRLRSSDATGQAPTVSRGGRIDPQQRVEQESVLRPWAESNGMLLGRDYYDNFVAIVEANEEAGRNPPSGEADVYRDKNTKRWLKLHESLISHQFESFSGFLDRLLIHAEIFPDTAYTLEGFAEAPGGRLVAVVSQNHVEAAKDADGNVVVADTATVDALMGSLGFEKRGYDSYVRGNVEVKDLHEGNVLVRPDGRLAVIDPIILTNSAIEDGLLSLSGDTATNQRVTPLTGVESAQWRNTLNVLAAAGIDVELLQRDVGADSDFFKSQNASYSRKQQLIQVVMNDTLQPNSRNLRALLHEVAHAVVGEEAPGFVRAVDALAIDILDGRANITEEHLRVPEEATVELLAMRLQDEGFGARSQTLAERFVRYLKDLYYRANLAVQKAVFGEDAVGPTLVLEYFDNRMRQFLAGDGDFLPSFLQHIGGPKPSKSAILSASSVHVPGSLPGVVIGRGGEVLFPDHLPEGDAVFSSGLYDGPVTAQMEQDYADAVKKGDTERAAELVKESARKAGYDTGVVHHGTSALKGREDEIQFTSFRVGSSTHGYGAFFTPNERMAQRYADRLKVIGGTGKVMNVYLRSSNPVVVSFNNAYTDFNAPDANSYFEVLEAKRQGYDSRIIKDDQGSVSEIIVWDPNQIKSADPITYDDAGNVIPLSHRFNPQTDDIRFSESNETPYRPPNVSRAWVDHATYAEAEIALRHIASETGIPYDNLLKGLGIKDPAKEREAAATVAPSAATAALENLTPAERQQAARKLTSLIGGYLHTIHTKSERFKGLTEKSTKLAEDEKTYISNLQNDPANAALLNDDIRKTLRKSFADYRKFAERAGEDFRLEGVIGEIVGEARDVGSNPELMHKEMVKTFEQLTGDSAQPIRFAQALASLGINFSQSQTSIPAILSEVKAYRNNKSFQNLSKEQQAEVAASLDRLNADPVLRAVMVAFARGNALRMDVLNMRYISEPGRFKILGDMVDDLRTASDERIRQLEQEVRDAVGDLTAKDRIKKDLLAHNRLLRAHEKRVAQFTNRIDVMAKAQPGLLLERKRWGDELGETVVYEGGPGSVFLQMDPKKGGAKLRTLTYQGWSEDPNTYRIAMLDNQNWLDLNEDIKDSAIYQEVKAMNERLQLDLVQRDQKAIEHNMFMRALQPLHSLFRKMGLAEGKLIGSALLQYEAAMKTLLAKTVVVSRKWEVAYQKVTEAAGYAGLPGEFNSKVRKHIIHRLERESGMVSENQAIDLAYRMIVEQVARSGSPKPVDQANLRKAVAKWLPLELKAGSQWDSERETMGVAIEDKAAWTVDPVTGKPRKMMRLKGVKQGWLTVPRRLRGDIFRAVNTRLETLNWFGTRESGFLDPKDKFWVKPGATVAEQSQILQRVSEAFAPATTNRYLREHFFDPFMNSEVSVFKGADESQVAGAWAASEGDVGFFIANLAADTNKDALEVADVVIKTLRSKANFARKIAGQSGNDNDRPSSATQTSQGHFIIDSRSDSTLPSHYFDYVQFDQYSSMTFASQLAATKFFGRGGERLSGLMQRLEQRLTDRANTISDTSASQKDKARKRKLEEDVRQVGHLWEKLRGYFHRADTGPYQDEKIYNEMVGLLVGNVLNNPKTSITQFITPIVGPALTYKGANLLTLGTSLGNIKTGIGAAAESVLQGIGWHFKNLPDDYNDLLQIVGGMNEAGLGFSENTVVLGRGDQFESRPGHKLLRQIRKVLDAPGVIVPGVRAKGSANRIPVRGLTGVFRWLASVANYTTAVGQLKMVKKVSEQVAEYMDAHNEWDNPDFNASDPKVLKEVLGAGYALNPLFGRADTLKLLYEQIEQRFSMSFADFVRQQRARRMQGQREFNIHDISAIAMIAEDEISMNAGLNSRPTWFFDNKIKPLTMLWGWPVMQSERVAQMAQNEKGEYDKRVLLKMATTMALFAMPVSLAYSLMLDLYDEFFRGKAPNLRKPGLDKTAGENALTAVERLARMGTFGMAGDVMNSFVNWSEYNGNGSGNPVSLDDRILLMSSARNMINGIRNWAMQGEASYATVGRPLLNAMGGNSMLQYIQLWNNATDSVGKGLPGPVGGILKGESMFTKRSNVYNIVRAAAREAKLPLNQGGGFSLPNRQRMEMREMQFAALSNDSEKFMEHYHNAVLAYMEDKQNPRTYQDAVKSVKSSWSYRHPLRTLFKQKLDPTEIALLYNMMPEGNRRDVQQAVMLHELYENLLGGPVLMGSTKRRKSVAAPI